jgi:hypothetical protein
MLKLSAALAVLLLAASADAAKTLQDYRYFRAISIDLVGRIPTRDEVAAFERDDFDVSGWIDEKLQSPAYAERLRRVYMDLLRLEISSAFQFVPSLSVLRRQDVPGPDGQTISIYFREGQRRTRPETDGAFCLTQAETGLQFPRYAPPTGTPIPVSQSVLDANTVTVRPWWLYRDYRSASPSQRYDGTWPGFTPVPELLTESDGGVQTALVRVCNEEAQTGDTGTIFVTNRTAPDAGTLPPYGRLTPLPLDSSYARQHAGEPISCAIGTAFPSSADCGCGVGLERCMPGGSNSFDPRAFTFPSRAPLGTESPFDESAQAQSFWQRFWWSQEATHFLEYLFAQDRDFREILSAHYSFVNGPLTQFYKSIAASTCCTDATALGYAEPEPLFSTSALPDLPPQDTATWTMVSDRGPQASGILTMPIFLTKFGTRRARAHVLYNAFLCRDFVAANVELPPSTEPNLMIRPGCSTCHATLEPLAAYFSRVRESDWTYLPASLFPVKSSQCAVSDPTRMSSACKRFYDPAFTDAQAATLRGAYASADHVEAGAAGIAAYLAQSAEFSSCVARNVASSFLGRATTDDDAALILQLANAFTGSGFHMRTLVGALVRSDAYRKSNNLSSASWRDGGAP